jgi:iron complex transport system substrate-binding protein
MRVVSLVPSVTDTLAALGAGELVVGVSADCSPPDGRPVPVVTRPVIPPESVVVDPAGVDATVRSLLEAGSSLYSLDVETIVDLRPDVLFAQDSCTVCALPSAEVAAVLRNRGLPVRVVSVDPDDLEAVLSSFSFVASALGDEFAAAGAGLAAECRQRLGALRSLSPGNRPNVLVLDWLDPPFIAGNWVPDLVQAAGGSAWPFAGETPAGGGPSRGVSVDELSSALPEFIVVALCGVDLGASVEVARQSPWLLSLARRAGARVIAFDGRVWFSRPGPRLVEGAEALAAWLSGDGAAPMGTAEIVGIAG